MKQEYKELMLKFLDNHPDIEITSNPIGWYRDLIYVGEDHVDSRNTTSYDIRKGKIETAMISLFVRDKAPKCISYKFKYDKEERAFKGKVKKRYTTPRNVRAEVKIDDEIWYDTMDVIISPESKSNVECTITYNIRNGMFPPNMVEKRKAIQNAISRQFVEQLKGEGRIAKDGHIRMTFRYPNPVIIEHTCNIITHKQEDVTINI